MNSNLNKYLSSVFRNEVEDHQIFSEVANSINYKTYAKDNQSHQFIVDKVYRLDLDEIM